MKHLDRKYFSLLPSALHIYKMNSFSFFSPSSILPRVNELTKGFFLTHFLKVYFHHNKIDNNVTSRFSSSSHSEQKSFFLSLSVGNSIWKTNFARFTSCYLASVWLLLLFFLLFFCKRGRIDREKNFNHALVEKMDSNWQRVRENKKKNYVHAWRWSWWWI